MPEQSIREAHGLVTTAIARLEEHPEVHHPGVRGHVVAAAVQLAAASALMAKGSE